MPCYLAVNCKDWWPYTLGGTELASLQDWFDAGSYVNAGGNATVTVDNPLGTSLVADETIIADSGYSMAAVAGLDGDAQLIACWSSPWDFSGSVFAFTNEYGQGRVYCQAAI